MDSSVWIDYFTGTDNKQTDTLNNIPGLKSAAIGDLILTEVLQGFRHDKHYKAARSLFNEVTTFEMLGTEMAIMTADNFRSLRKKGITVRKTADIIIASFCIVCIWQIYHSAKAISIRSTVASRAYCYKRNLGNIEYYIFIRPATP